MRPLNPKTETSHLFRIELWDHLWPPCQIGVKANHWIQPPAKADVHPTPGGWLASVKPHVFSLWHPPLEARRISGPSLGSQHPAQCLVVATGPNHLPRDHVRGFFLPRVLHSIGPEPVFTFSFHLPRLDGPIFLSQPSCVMILFASSSQSPFQSASRLPGPLKL